MGSTQCLNIRDEDYKKLRDTFEIADSTMQVIQNAFEDYKRTMDVEAMRLNAEKLGQKFDEKKAWKEVKKRFYDLVEPRWVATWLEGAGHRLSPEIRFKYLFNMSSTTDAAALQESNTFDKGVMSKDIDYSDPSFAIDDLALAKEGIKDLKAANRLFVRLMDAPFYQKELNKYQGDTAEKMRKLNQEVLGNYQKALQDLLKRENWQAEGRFGKQGLYGGQLIPHPGILQQGLTTTIKNPEKGDDKILYKPKSKPTPNTEAGDFVHSILGGISNHVMDMQKNGEFNVSKEAIEKWLNNNIEKLFVEGNYKTIEVAKIEGAKEEMVKNITTFLERFFKKFYVMGSEVPIAHLDPTKDILTRTNVDLIVMDKDTLDRGIIDFKSKGMENFLDPSAFVHFTEQKNRDIPSAKHMVDLQTQAEATIINEQMQDEKVFKEGPMQEFNNEPFINKRYVVSIDLEMVKSLNYKTMSEKGTLLNMRGAIIEKGKNILGKNFLGGGVYELADSPNTLNEVYEKLGIDKSTKEDHKFQSVMKEMIYSQKNLAQSMGAAGATKFRANILSKLFDLNVDADYIAPITANFTEIKEMRDMLNSGAKLPIETLEKFSMAGKTLASTWQHLSTLMGGDIIVDDQLLVQAPNTSDALKEHFQEILGLNIDDPGVKDALSKLNNVISYMGDCIQELGQDLTIAKREFLQREWIPKLKERFLGQIREDMARDNITTIQQANYKKLGAKAAKIPIEEVERDARKMAIKQIEGQPAVYERKATDMAEQILGLIGYNLESKDMLTQFEKIVESFAPVSAMKNPIIKSVTQDIQKALLYKQKRHEELEAEMRPIVQKILEKEGGGNLALRNSTVPYEKIYAFKKSEKWVNSNGENVEPYLPMKTDWKEFNTAKHRALEEIKRKYHVEPENPAYLTDDEKVRMAAREVAEAQWYKDNTEWIKGYEGEEVPVYDLKDEDGEENPFAEIAGTKRVVVKAAEHIRDKVLSFVKDAVSKGLLDKEPLAALERELNVIVEQQKAGKGENMLLNLRDCPVWTSSDLQNQMGKVAKIVLNNELDKIRQPIEKYNDPNFARIEALSPEMRAYYDLEVKYREIYDTFMDTGHKIGQRPWAYYGDRTSAASVARQHAKETGKSKASVYFGAQTDARDLLSDFEGGSCFKFPYSANYLNPNDVSNNAPEGLYAAMKSLIHYEAYREPAAKFQMLMHIMRDVGGAEFDKRTGLLSDKANPALVAVKTLVDTAIFHDGLYKGSLMHWFKALYDYSTVVALGTNAGAAFRSHWQSAFDLRCFYGQSYPDGTKGILQGHRAISNFNFWTQHAKVLLPELSRLAHVPGLQWENKTKQFMIADWMGAVGNKEYEPLMPIKPLERMGKRGSIWNGVKESLFGFFHMTDNYIKEVTAETMTRNLIAYDKDGKKMGNFYNMMEVTGKKGVMVKGRRIDDRKIELKGEDKIAYFGQEGTDKKAPYSRPAVQIWYNQMIGNTTSVSSIVQEATMAMAGVGGGREMFQLKGVAMKALMANIQGYENPIDPSLNIPGRMNNLLDKNWWNLPNKAKIARALTTIPFGVGTAIRRDIMKRDVKAAIKTGEYKYKDYWGRGSAYTAVLDRLAFQTFIWAAGYILREMLIPVGFLGKLMYGEDGAKQKSDFYLDQKLDNSMDSVNESKRFWGAEIYNVVSAVTSSTSYLGSLLDAFSFGPKETALYGAMKNTAKFVHQAIKDLSNMEMQTYKTGIHKGDTKLFWDFLKITPAAGIYNSLHPERKLRNKLKNDDSLY